MQEKKFKKDENRNVNETGGGGSATIPVQKKSNKNKILFVVGAVLVIAIILTIIL